MEQSKFSYKNYLAPTPEHLQIWVEGIQGALVVIIGTSWVQGADPKWLLGLSLAGYILDKVSKFFGKVAEDKQKFDIHVEGKDVTITKEEIQDENKS